jgi:hypothetical protein
MGSHYPFGHLKHKLWPKERPKVKLAVWFSTIKNQESTRFPCIQVACDIPLESSIKGLHTKLWGPKVVGVPTLAISGFPLGSPGTKSHLDVGLVERHKLYYKGEGGDFPQVWAMASLVSLSCSWFVLTSKVLHLCTNHLVLVLCRSVWVVDACHSS